MNEIVKQLRLSQSLNHHQLSVKSGVQSNQIKLFEEGKKGINVKGLEKILTALGHKLAAVKVEG